MSIKILSKHSISLLVSTILLIFLFTVNKKTVYAQNTTSPSILYVPLIGITSVPSPLSLPKGPGKVTFNYAVKNFLQEVSLNNVQVVDDKCSPVKFVTGDDNHDGKLDFNETWRYSCTTKLSVTTQSVATATGFVDAIPAVHKAFATVVVGSDAAPPLVSIVNITKVAYPLTLPQEGGSITFTYKVNNPGIVPLGGVTVIDDKCANMSGKLGDTNGNNLLDTNEVWIFTCTTILRQTTTNTVTVTAYANGLKAIDSASLTVKVANPKLPNAGPNPNPGNISTFKITTWEILAGILGVLFIVFVLSPKRKLSKAGVNRP